MIVRIHDSDAPRTLSEACTLVSSSTRGLDEEMLNLVEKMRHRCQRGLCGREPGDPCRCEKKFPYPLNDAMHIDTRGYVQYRREEPGDQYVVSFIPQVLKLWQGHANVKYVHDSSPG